jgi:limonene-1,2-epoxide hydrolase
MHLYSDRVQPKQVVQAWVAAFNRGDADEIAGLYTENAVNHQVANEAVRGRAAIHAMFTREFAAAQMVCQIENLFQDGDWAILEWQDPLGLRGCGFFRIEGTKIAFSTRLLGQTLVFEAAPIAR